MAINLLLATLVSCGRIEEGYPAVILDKNTSKKDLRFFYPQERIVQYVPLQPEEFVQKRATDALTSATIKADTLIPTVYSDRKKRRALAIVQPQDGASFPPNIAPPLFAWDDPVNDLWLVAFCGGAAGDTLKILTRAQSVRLQKNLWDRITETHRNGCVVMTVSGCQTAVAGEKKPIVQRSHPISFRISGYPADDFVLYRTIRPGFYAAKVPDIRIRHISTFREGTFLSSGGRYCLGCHTFSSKRAPERFAVQWRSVLEGKGSLAVFDMQTGGGGKIALPFKGSTFMSWNNEQTKLALTVNCRVAAKGPVTHETQYAYTKTADIGIYDAEVNEAFLLPGASEPEFLEDYPAWSADGATIAFCRDSINRAKQGRYYQRYDIYLVPFNNGTGGTPVPLPGGSLNGKSNYFPRFSPDGRWISFCQANFGSLVVPSGDIYLYARRTGEVKRLECNVDYAADSWHSWSSNSRWLVFTSKRDDGIFSRLYCTEIDETGKASPAVPLPVTDPGDVCFNTPEFLNTDSRRFSRRMFFAIDRRDSFVQVGEGGQ